jgi:hypothetical protein
MFRDAYKLAREFTRPVVISRRTVAGDCTGGGGAFVVVNDEGWIITAAHIIQQIADLNAQEASWQAHQAKEAAIRADASLSVKERQKQLQSLGKPKASDTTNGSVWWGGVGSGVKNISAIWLPNTPIDLALAQLENFDKSLIAAYPRFMKPTEVDAPGTSLCKLGYPFFQAQPVWDPAQPGFMYPPGQLPPSLFPLEGMLTRIQSVQAIDQAGNLIQFPVPLQGLETSTPGLKGQSGGPIFDIHGNVWALQCLTSHTPLGFEPAVVVNGKQHTEHQFINMGSGPSATTITAWMTHHGVSFDVVP